MRIKKIIIAAVAALSLTNANAGGFLTNTNQNVAFLRNPAREGAIGIDGVYSNPAGVALLNDGFHLSLNWQAAWQTRTINTTCPLFALGVQNNGQTTKEFEGKANAPFIPSVQAAYNKKRWSFQFGFSVTGGGGKCEFADGLGSFESAVGQIANGMKAFGAQGYDANSYMQGKQFYFGFTLGAAYKLIDEEKQKLSVFGGMRILYGNASYKAKVSDITVKTENGMVPFSQFLDGANAYITTNLASIEEHLPKVDAGIAQLEPVKTLPGYKEQYDQLVATKAQLEGAKAQLEGARPQVNALEVYRDGVNLQADQNGVGFAPIIGIDYQIGNFNFAAKYDFRVKMSMENESTLKEAMAIEAVNQFQDGTSIREDSPALLALGTQWSIVPTVRVNAGYHHFYDKQSKKYANKQDFLSGGTNEYIGGIELDVTDRLTLSGGIQVTRYGLTDEYMSDLSFVTDSWSFGVGAKYKVSDKVAINAAYFQTNYDNYEMGNPATIANDFTRSNYVGGVGVELTF